MSQEETKTPQQEMDILRAEIDQLRAQKNVILLKRQLAKMKTDDAGNGESVTIESISDFFSTLQTEAEAVKAGIIDADMARALARIRGHQLKTAELQLRHAQLYKGRLPDPRMKLIADQSKP